MKTKNLFISSILLGATAFTFTACDPKKDEPSTPVITTGTYVLNSGSYGKNNASLSFYDLTKSEITADIFNLQNSKGLGDTGQDALIYGSKLYIVVYNSSTIQVLNAKTAKLTKTISMESAPGVPSFPRYMASFNGNIYVTQWDGTVACLDTVNLSVTKTVKVGPNPEGIVVANNKLYVAISGGLNTVKDSTVAVINPTSFAVEKSITVGLNPQNIVSDNQGNIYVLAMGNYSTIMPSLKKIVDGTTPQISVISNITPRDMELDGDNLYIITYSYDLNWDATDKKLVVYNTKSSSISSNSLLKGDGIFKTPYCIDINPISKDIYIGESDYVSNGKMYCYDKDGAFKFSFVTGINPIKTIFITNK
jgi:YVTN family beta-propeller protein